MLMHKARVVVTGGASGLGEAVARRCVETGATVTLLDVAADKGAATARDLGESAAFVCCDVTREADVDAAVAAAAERMGGIDVAVSCAGVGWPKRLLGKEGAMPGDFFRKVIEINLIGTLLFVKASAAAMQKNEPNDGGERGVIVMTASIAAFDGQIGQVAYSASKGGVVGMTLPMARELASSGIRVMTVAPGIFLTPMLASLPQEVQDSLGRQVPFPPRLGQPAEFAALIEQICTNPMLNGETIRLDGAIRMQPR
jgi:NAD(P)-dependent dehydrogenase (short-subunit alcohol dehydrogenase family)